MTVKEFCAENYTDVPKAIRAGAKRIELCDNLAVGGTTPSVGVLQEVLNYAHEENVTVMTMIRPRGGDFVYNDTELKMMDIDILTAAEKGTDGVVFGCLDEDNWIDEEAVENLLVPSAGLKVTFHMAFDDIPVARQKEAIDYLVANNVDTILTHGGPLTSPISENFAHLKDLIAYAEDRITLLVGGGVNADNFEEVVAATGTREVHGTKIVKLGE
jgi:copper homeostasis protein